MSNFEEFYGKWLEAQIANEANVRRKELLLRGLGHGTVEFLRQIWLPAVGSFDHLQAEYEVRDMKSGFRYLDLAYMPGGAKGCIEIHGYRSHARDVDARRFKDLCMKQALLVLDDWHFLPVAYLSITEDPAVCRQLVLSFVGKFLVQTVRPDLDWAEAETLRYIRRLLRPVVASEVSVHLRLSDRRTRNVLQRLVAGGHLMIANGAQRYRTYSLPTSALLN